MMARYCSGEYLAIPIDNFLALLVGDNDRSVPGRLLGENQVVPKSFNQVWQSELNPLAYWRGHRKHITEHSNSKS